MIEVGYGRGRVGSEFGLEMVCSRLFFSARCLSQ